jgi:CPA2 family monovalent cation:H+ antiporter-2
VPGERLIRRGDTANEVFFVSSGQVEVSVSGRKVRLGPGDLFGEMGLVSDAPRNADVTALDYTTLLTLDKADFRAFASAHPALRAELLQVKRSTLGDRIRYCGLDREQPPRVRAGALAGAEA